jgi:hypothetical protein
VRTKIEPASIAANKSAMLISILRCFAASDFHFAFYHKLQHRFAEAEAWARSPLSSELLSSQPCTPQ